MRAPTYVDPMTTILEAEKAGETVTVTVKALNKGGVIVTLGEMKGACLHAKHACACVLKTVYAWHFS